MAAFGLVFQLQWWGILCPCLEKEEDKAARQSLVCLQNRRVRWHPTGSNNNSNNNASGVANLVVGFFTKSNNRSSSSRNSKNAIWAKLLVVDDATNGPTLQISPVVTNNSNNNNNSDDETTLSSDSMDEQPLPELSKASSAASFMKCIPLRQVKQVQEGGGGGTKESESCSIVLLDANQHVLVRLDICKKQAHDQQQFVSAAERTEVMDALSILLHWVQRCPNSNEDDAADDSPVRNRVQQAAHFAKREIELQQKKREREKRKAGYLEQSKGLKYTAIAMANREEGR